MSIKDYLLRKMLASKMKDVPAAEQEKVFAMLEKNPELFQKIGLETQELVKGGMDQMTAAMQVMKKYESELKSLA
jgi:hypothetical protein